MCCLCPLCPWPLAKVIRTPPWASSTTQKSSRSVGDGEGLKGGKAEGDDLDIA